MTDPPVQGALEHDAHGALAGWCWAPAAPQTRRIVEILDGEAVLLRLVAAAHRPDLAAAGIGDGAHGFRAQLPMRPAALRHARVIRARDADTGQVFGERRDDAPDLGADPLDTAASAIAVLQREITAMRARLARRQSARTTTPLDPLAALLAQRTGPASSPFTLPSPPARPTVTLLLIAAPDSDTTLASLRALATALHQRNAELRLVDDGQDPRTVLLPGAARGLLVVPATGTGLADTLNAAAATAHGDTLLLLEADAAPPSATALGQLLDAVIAAPDRILAGAAATAALTRWGAAPATGRPTPTPLLISLPRRLWREAGGLDPAHADGAGLELADLCLRLRLLGADPRSVSPSHPTAPPRVAPDPARAWQAALRFREAWSDLALAPGKAP